MCTFFILTCEKELPPVPEDQKLDSDVNYFAPDSSVLKTLFVDSLVLRDCAGPQPYGELPDIVFCFSFDDCSDCYSTSDQVLTNLTPAALPQTLIPSSLISNQDSLYAGSLKVKVVEYSAPVNHCNPTATNDLIGEFELSYFDLNQLAAAGFNRIALRNFFVAFTLYFHLQ